MRYLSGDQILIIHSLLIEEAGGLHGVRDNHLLQSIIHKPQGVFGGKELYKGVFVKAAIYFESLASYHVFIDGNKRTAFTVAARFLEINGYKLEASGKTIETFVVTAVVEKWEIKDITAWLRKHTRKFEKRK
ncbi:MAG: type II toxin-antitoxin system death-on-curing family toxin [Patescibacteria group bacterium]